MKTMSDEFKRPDGQISLDDQAFLNELGISGMPTGLEKALRHYKAAMKAKADIKSRAEGLQSLDLNDQTLDQLARENRESPSEVREKLGFFRDLEKWKQD